jgi:hypothetical protein
MKKLLTVLAFALFTLSVSAQETKPAKKQSCCAKTMTAEEKAKCEAKCKADGKVCTANEKKECKTEAKSCCAKKA